MVTGGSRAPAVSSTGAAFRGFHPVALLLALGAAVWHASLITHAANDNFVHMTLAQQLLAGDWPVRDFFDHGWVLQYTLTAVAEILIGHRLLAEAVVIGAAWAVSTYAVYALVLRLGGSRLPAVVASLLLIVSSARGYSYPKGIVYAIAALLWWRYVMAPTRARMIALGAWAAVAFYWRPDHGVLVAVAIVLAACAAHGLRGIAVARTSLAAATMLVLILPFMVYVQAVLGLPEYARTGILQAEVEHTTQGPHEWPVLRFAGNIVTVVPAAEYAPVIGIRWHPSTTPEARAAIFRAYELTPVPGEDNGVTRVRLSPRAIDRLRQLLNEPLVDDTAGIDRSRATLPPSTWPTWRRWAFRYAVLRLRVLPELDSQARTTEFAVALLYLIPIGAVVAAPWLSHRLASGATAAALIAFAAFALLVDIAMLRHPFEARAADGVVLPAVLLGCWMAALWRRGTGGHQRGRAVGRVAAVACGLVVLANVAGAGEFVVRASPLVGGLTSPRRARAAWTDVYREVIASPPLAYYQGRRARLSLRFAAYARECVPANDRLLVLWFEPEIYYYSGRLMAQRHLVFAPAWSSLPEEQRLTLDKVRRFAPPLVLARRSALEAYARPTFPLLVGYVESAYRLAASLRDGGEEYLIFARRDRAPLRTFGPEQWPCYSTGASS